MNKLILLMLGLVCASVQAQDGISPLLSVKAASGGFTLNNKGESVSPQEAGLLVAEKHAIIVDVREESEWRQQHISNAVNIPLGQLTGRFIELEQYKQTPIITQCRSGRRSKQALAALKLAGFTHVYNLDGGLMAWDKAGLKTVP